MALTKVHNRMIKGSVVNVLDYATGDGVTDDKDAIQAAINAGDVIYFPPTANGYKVGGTGQTTDRLIINSSKKLIGDEMLTKIVHSNDEWLFELRGNNIEIDGFYIDSSAATTAGRGAILLRSDLSSMENLRISNITTLNSRYGIRDLAHASNLIVDLIIDRFVCTQHNGIGISLETAFAYIRLNECTIDFVNGTSIDHVAYIMKNNEGSVWNSCDVTGGTVDGTTTSQIGFYFDDCTAVWMNGCMADTVGSYGFQLDTDCTAFYFDNCVASLCGNSGWVTGATCSSILITGCVSSGRRGQAYAPANVNGFHAVNSNALSFANCTMKNNTLHGIYFQAATRYDVIGGRFDNNGAYGIKSDSTSTGIITGAAFDANVTNNAQLSSANEHIVNCQLGSGALGSLTGSGTV